MTEEELAQIEAWQERDALRVKGHPMPTRFALALALIALAIFAVYGDQIIVTFYVLDATRVLPFWQVATILGLVGLVLAYRPSSD